MKKPHSIPDDEDIAPTEMESPLRPQRAGLAADLECKAGLLLSIALLPGSKAFRVNAGRFQIAGQARPAT